MKLCEKINRNLYIIKKTKVILLENKTPYITQKKSDTKTKNQFCITLFFHKVLLTVSFDSI